ncbi:hypothetical protein [Chryseobacterium sp.]|uniref:hypothetical protein n=1 Tax=Chryseobacterium sp. TaxID=1871047 RepID=UPI00321C29DC
MKLTKDNIKAGLHIWIKEEGKPVEMIIRTGITVHGDSYGLTLDKVNPKDEFYSFIAGTSTYGIYLGDYGVPGYAYDGRACQVFTTKEELIAAMKIWGGFNPNFIDDYGNQLNLEGFIKEA